MMQLVHVLHEFEVAPDGRTLEQHYLSQGDGRISNNIDQEALKENKKLQSFVPTRHLIFSGTLHIPMEMSIEVGLWQQTQY